MIPLYKVFMPKGVEKKIKEVINSGYVAEGPISKKFEAGIQEYVGNQNTAIVNSCTSAIIIALRLCGVGPGTTVICSPQTCLATTQPVLSLGADIIWCDVDIKTGNIDSSKVEELIRDNTKAILFVDWVGVPAELDKINEIAKRHGVKTIEDAAQALGSFYKGRHIGNDCDFTVFSFQAIKMLSTVDGGCIACKTKEDYNKAVLMRWFGMSRNHSVSCPVSWEGDVLDYGYKMNFNDLSASIGIEQLKYVNKNVLANKRNAKMLIKGLTGLDGLELFTVSDYIDPVFWVFPIMLKNEEHRELVSKRLSNAGISNSILHTRNDVYSIFKKYKKNLPNLDVFSSRMLNIPCGWWLSKKDVYFIIDAVRKSI